MNKTIDINVPVLARVEGEGALDLRIEDGRITDLKLRIFEPPRYFEKFLEGRSYMDVLDTVARICGICPVAYQMSAAQAIEAVFRVQETPWVQSMRKLMYCGEWLQSHSLHIHMLAAPDFLGVNSVIEMAVDNLEAVQRGLRLQALGNDLIALLGARSVHPVGMCVGGFFSAPGQADVDAMKNRLQDAMADAEGVLQWVSGFNLPDDTQDFISVSLRHAQDYPMNGGRIVSDSGLDIAIEDYEQYFAEQHISHSTALHSLLEGRPYLVGPLARLNLNQDRLPPTVKSALQRCGVSFPSKNMFHSIIARAIEILYAVHAAHELLQDYKPAAQPAIQVNTSPGTGFGCTEAPRGLLWHRYELDQNGTVQRARIVPPTSQNQARMEQDLSQSLYNYGLENKTDKLRLHAEKVIRNYDPCISCATHFLKLSVDRGENPDDETVAAQPACIQTKAASARNTKDTVRIIGVGSPVGGDVLGWQVVQRLRNDTGFASRPGLQIVYLDRPGLQLLDAMQGAAAVILVDAVSGTAAQGSVVETGKDALLEQESRLSTHHLGVAEALQLAHALNRLPEKLLLVGLETGGDAHWLASEYELEELTRVIQNRAGD